MTYIYDRLQGGQAFEIARRYSQYENVTHPEFIVLFEYYEQLAEDTGTPMEFDPIAWVCDFSLLEEEEALEEYEVDSIDELEEEHFVLRCPHATVWVQL
jgi:hypothetical protein